METGFGSGFTISGGRIGPGPGGLHVVLRGLRDVFRMGQGLGYPAGFGSEEFHPTAINTWNRSGKRIRGNSTVAWDPEGLQLKFKDEVPGDTSDMSDATFPDK